MIYCLLLTHKSRAGAKAFSGIQTCRCRGLRMSGIWASALCSRPSRPSSPRPQMGPLPAIPTDTRAPFLSWTPAQPVSLTSVSQPESCSCMCLHTPFTWGPFKPPGVGIGHWHFLQAAARVENHCSKPSWALWPNLASFRSFHSRLQPFRTSFRLCLVPQR